MSNNQGAIDKDQKYDRQLRLWGAHGQAQLENAKFCLLNGDAVGSETLKNLILPGIGEFTIVDDSKTSEIDLGNNFFVEAESVGKNRAEEVTRLLQELNPDSKGNAISKSVVELIENEISFFDSFTHIIASNIPEKSLIKLSDYLWKKTIPLFVLKTNGFLGYLRIVKEEHNVIETKADNPQNDLRISEPFESLKKLSESRELSEMTSKEHSHWPWIYILTAQTLKWKKSHDNKLPQTRDEKNQFKQSIRDLSPSAQEENFNEAFGQVHTAYMPYSIPSATKSILSHEKAKPKASSEKFWQIAAAVSTFVENEGAGKLPLPGNVPDLTTTTDWFLELQKTYQTKAKNDAEAVYNHLKTQIGDEEAEKIGLDDVVEFCRHVNTIKNINYKSLSEEYSNTIKLNGDATWYALFRIDNEDLNGEDDESKLNSLKKALSNLKIEGTPSDDQLKHWIRSDNAQLHNTAAVIGGIASQEIIKIVTQQYVPVEGTFIWNGLNSTSTNIRV